MYKKILVTDGAGFIGSRIVDECVRRGHRVNIFDNLDPQIHSVGMPPSYLNKDSELIIGDVRDYNSFKKAVKGVDIIFHHAACVGVDANMAAMEKEDANNQVFNVGSGVPVTIKRIAETLSHSLGVDIRPKVTTNYRRGDTRHCFADTKKIETMLGFKPRISFEKGIDELIHWSSAEACEDNFEKASCELRVRGLV